MTDMRVLRPATLEEAVGMRAAAPEAVPIAGGTDLMVHWPETPELQRATYLDLSGIGEMRALRWHEDELELGALTTYWDVMQEEQVNAELPLLPAAARTVGAVQIQSRGTWAGNIANASPAADGVPVLMAYDAEVELVSAAGARRVALADFYHGYKQLESRADELISRVFVPRRRRTYAEFIKVGARRAQAITKVGVALAQTDDGWRVVANSVAPFVCRCPRLEQLLVEGTPVAGPQDLTAAIRDDVSPIDDIRSTAVYRERVLGRILYHALREVCPAFS